MRRALVIGLLAALCASGSAFAAPGRLAGDPLQGQEWWLPAVGADRATPPGPGVPVTIVDSSFDQSHPELAGRPDTTFLDPQSAPGPDDWRGTAAASIAAAPANGVGLVGVYPSAALQLWDAGAGGKVASARAAEGVQAAAAHCPGVIDLGFGGLDRHQDLAAAILGAVHRGCLVVAPAGTTGDTNNPAVYPAALPHVLAVAATDEHDQVATLSSGGPWVDLAAPGADMTAAVPLSRDPSGYAAATGTSLSAAMVAGAAGWIWTQHPTLTPEQLTAILRSSARDVGPRGFDIATGYGILDVPSALAARAPRPDPREPNDNVDQVKPGALFPDGRPALTTRARTSRRISGTLEPKDRRDVYRVWVPAGSVVRASVSSRGAAAYRIWGPRTSSIDERVRARRRDLKGPLIRGGSVGFTAYVEVLLTGLDIRADYVLSVTASRR